MSSSDVETFRTICQADAVPADTVVPHYLPHRKLRIALAHVGGQFFAFDDLCSCAAQRCSLSSGLLTGTTLMCQCHGSRFDIVTGAVIEGPATNALHLYEMRHQDGTIQVRLPPAKTESSATEERNSQ